MKEGFLEGMMDGIIIKTVWDGKTAKAKKDFTYLLGNIADGIVQPGAYGCFLLDCIRDNYKF